MRVASIFLSAFLFATATLVSPAETITYTLQKTFLNFAGTEDYFFNFPRFDPSLGTLDSVIETLSGNVVLTGSGSYRLDAENGLKYVVTSSGPFDLSITLPTSQNAQYTGTAGVKDPDLLRFLTIYREGTASLSSIGPVVNTYQYNYTPVVTAATPEPPSWLLLGMGTAGLCGGFRRRS